MLNIAAIMGRLTADPELRTTPSGVSVTSFTLAVDRSYCKPGEERQADFINVVAWRGAAEFVCKYFTKGQMMGVTGSIQTRNYEDKQGSKRTAFEIVASDISFAGSKRENNGQSSTAAFGPGKQSDPQEAFPNGSDLEEYYSSDDDLPF